MLLEMAVAGGPERAATGRRATGMSYALLQRTAAGVANIVRSS
ncbi:MAG: hypothetical protein JWN52_4792 [Actinomycetia bacterium]|nr:hypothetical protein [Actinomycetes bacterium]